MAAGGAARGAPRDLQTVRAVQQRYEKELFRRYNATGIAIGTAERQPTPPEPEDPVYVIVVYVLTAGEIPDHPQAIGGVEIKFVRAGPFRAS